MIVWNGMEQARQWSREKGVLHYAIIDHADRLNLTGYRGPVIVELVPSGLQARSYDSAEAWERTAIADIAGAGRRLRELLNMPERRRYDWFFNNCEHIARYIATGEFRSNQIRGVAAVALLLGLMIWAAE